eukprot:1162014-Pelagomonas_calceolata.AAC.3
MHHQLQHCLYGQSCMLSLLMWAFMHAAVQLLQMLVHLKMCPPATWARLYLFFWAHCVTHLVKATSGHEHHPVVTLCFLSFRAHPPLFSGHLAPTISRVAREGTTANAQHGYLCTRQIQSLFCLCSCTLAKQGCSRFVSLCKVIVSKCNTMQGGSIVPLCRSQKLHAVRKALLFPKQGVLAHHQVFLFKVEPDSMLAHHQHLCRYITSASAHTCHHRLGLQVTLTSAHTSVLFLICAISTPACKSPVALLTSACTSPMPLPASHEGLLISSRYEGNSQL